MSSFENAARADLVMSDYDGSEHCEEACGECGAELSERRPMLAGGLYERTSGAAGQPLRHSRRRAPERTVHRGPSQHGHELVAPAVNELEHGRTFAYVIARTAAVRPRDNHRRGTSLARCSSMSKLALLLVVLAGCEADVPERTSSGEPTQMREWRAQLTSREAEFVGSVTLETNLDAEAFTATIGVRGEVPGEVRSWHVHLGTCASGGPIIGTQAAYPDLTIGADGTASASSIVFAPLDLDLTYHATVHNAANEVIACGNFSELSAIP